MDPTGGWPGPSLFTRPVAAGQKRLTPPVDTRNISAAALFGCADFHIKKNSGFSLGLAEPFKPEKG